MTTDKASHTIQLYLLANNASTRLQTEAHRPDCHLRRMVLHANMLDHLTTEIDAIEHAIDISLKIPVQAAKPGKGHRPVVTVTKATAA